MSGHAHGGSECVDPSFSLIILFNYILDFSNKFRPKANIERIEHIGPIYRSAFSRCNNLFLYGEEIMLAPIFDRTVTVKKGSGEGRNSKYQQQEE